MVGIFKLEPGDDPAAIDTLDVERHERQPVVKSVTLRDQVTGDEQVVNAEMQNIILILKQVGYQVVEETSP